MYIHTKPLFTTCQTQKFINLISHNKYAFDEVCRCIYSGKIIFKDKNEGGDWMGPAHKVSNLITWKYHVPKNETKLERQLREKRIEVHKWNQEFWEKHNINFFKAQKEYVKNTLQEKYLNEPTRTTLPADDMSKFYKQFLDDNHQMHMSYNRKWYQKNFLLLWYAFKVVVNNIIRR